MSAVLFAALNLTWLSQARAQQLPAAEVAAAPAAPPNVASLDPNIDRAFIQPTAMTQPAGSVTYNNYELLLHGVTYGLTDNVQTTVTVLSPIVKDMPFIGFAAVKGRISPADRVHLALQGSVGFGHEFSTTSNDANAYSAGAGGYASFCLRADCASLINGSVNYQYAAGSNGSSGEHLLIYGGSLVVRASEHLKLLGEITSAAGRSGSSELDNISGFLVSYGVRFHGANFAGDVGFIKPVDTSGNSNDALLLGIPFVSLSYRWN
jgi:hypothetical protein